MSKFYSKNYIILYAEDFFGTEKRSRGFPDFFKEMARNFGKYGEIVGTISIKTLYLLDTTR